MVKLHLKNYQYIFGILLLLTGIIFFVWMSGTIQYVGIVFIVMGYAYLAYMIYTKIIDNHERPSRSRMRDHITKFQFRK